MQPDVTVLLTVYNTPVAWLAECMGSVVHQAHEGFSFEVLVVDDGSTSDETCQRLEQIGRWRDVRVLRREARMGVGIARQAGLEVAHAPLVALIGSDDVMPPGRLAAQWEYMVAYKFDVLAGQMDYMAPDGAVLARPPLSYNWTRPLHGQGFCIADPTVMYQRQAVLDAGGYSARRRAPDHYLWLQMDERGARFHVADEVWALYRVHPDSLSFSHSPYQQELYRLWEMERALPHAVVRP